jgi:hypothetical protein
LVLKSRRFLKNKDDAVDLQINFLQQKYKEKQFKSDLKMFIQILSEIKVKKLMPIFYEIRNHLPNEENLDQ